MASIRKHRARWQVQIRIKGTKPITKSFARKAEAIRWSRAVEGEIAVGAYIDPRKADSALLADVIDQYSISLNEKLVKDPARRSRLKRLRADLGVFSLGKLCSHHLHSYCGKRREVVSETTISHELALLRHLLGWAESKLGIVLPKGMPLIPMPQLPNGRDRRLVADEESRLLSACGDDVKLKAFVELAIETAMRRSELIGILPDHIDSKNSVLLIPKTKNGETRTIPLSPRAKSILASYMGENGMFAGTSPTRISQKFTAACKQAEIQGLRLHDLRHEAISRLVERGLSTLEIAAISGHKTLSMLARYSHPDPSYLATKLV
ncbi:MAG: site-specific integrase [Halioglobus sp.]